MLTVLQYAALASAFFLPWTIGGIITHRKDKDRRVIRLYVYGLTAVMVIIAVTLIIAFNISAG